MRLVIIDYGMGNLHSVQQAFRHLGQEVIISSQSNEILRADGVVLPGVGAFPPAMSRLAERGLDRVMRSTMDRQIPILGICLGMQLFYHLGMEDGQTPGLGLLQGKVLPLPPSLKVPHMGWNQLRQVADSPLLEGIPEGAYAYFVHSYYATATLPQEILAVTDYGLEIPALVGRGRLYGTQFHPEKSGEVGLQLLRNFLEVIRC